jgi:hypothetical protein
MITNGNQPTSGIRSAMKGPAKGPDKSPSVAAAIDLSRSVFIVLQAPGVRCGVGPRPYAIDRARLRAQACLVVCSSL